MNTAVAEKQKSETIPAEKEPAPLATLRSQLEQRAGEFRMVLPSHITPEKLQRTILTAVQSNPDLLLAERRSFLTACMKAAQDGLLPDGREAAIVPFNHRYKDVDGWHTIRLAQYMPMVWGLRKKILQSGEIAAIHVGVVYNQELETGRFIYEEGSEQTLRHKPIVAPDFSPTDEDVALAYSVAVFKNGLKSFEVMRRFEIDEVRESSQTGAQYDAKGNPREAKGPWVEWFAEMAKKTVLRRHSKSLPMSGDILPDVEAEDMAFASKSAVAVLGSQAPSSPTPLITDEDHGLGRDQPEPETDEGGDGPEPEPEIKPPLRPKPELAPEQIPEPEPRPDPGPEPLPEAAPESPAPQPDSGPDSFPTDAMGVTVDPNEALADDFIKRAQRCELLTDLRTLEREADLALAEMPTVFAVAVDEAFARARQRMTPPPKTPPPSDE